MATRKRGHLEREWRKAVRAMAPNRVLARFASGGKHQTFSAIARAGLGLNVPGPRSIPMRPVPYGSPLPTTKASAAKSRASATKKAAAAKQPVIKQTARGKQVAKRKAKGQFDGSVTLPGADLTAYRRAVAGQVDPAQQVRQPRRRK
jgi:hypothetical protein